MTDPHDALGELHTELDRRLDAIAAPGYDDPARRPLAALDIALLAVFVVAVSLLSYVVLY
jgi:hypothetical protein